MLAHPDCPTHAHSLRRCAEHGGDWSPFQCWVCDGAERLGALPNPRTVEDEGDGWFWAAALVLLLAVVLVAVL